MAPTDRVLVHAPPSVLKVDVRAEDGSLVAFGDNLRRTLASPMARLSIDGGNVTREDLWPTPSEWGLPVFLPGGEVGILESWWHDDDHSQWRWTVEFSNHI